MGIPVPDVPSAWEESPNHYSFKDAAGEGGADGFFSCPGHPAPVMQSPGSGGKKKSAGRRMPGRAAAKSGADVGDADSGIVEKQDGIPAEGGSSGRNPAESALPETMPPPDGDIPAQESGETEPGRHAFFTQEQLAAIREKGLDLSRLTEDGIRQMARQVQDGIPARAAYKEALMWCR